MPSFSDHHHPVHARLTADDFRFVVLLTAAWLTLGLGAAAGASERTATSSSVRSTTTTRPQAQQPTGGRYRGHGQVRGGTGRPPVGQPTLVPTLSGLHPPGFTVRPIGSRTTPIRHGRVPRGQHHHPPQVIYVPVTYGFDSRPSRDRVIVLEAPAAPPPVFVMVPQAGGSTAAATGSSPAVPQPPPAPAPYTSNAPGSLRIETQPAGAEVFLDDRLLTASGEVAGRHQVSAKPGVHVLEITHPEHGAERLIFAVDPEESVVVAVDLRESRPGRRTRID